MNRDLVLRRERPDDLEPTRALHDLAFGVPEGAEHSPDYFELASFSTRSEAENYLTKLIDLGKFM